MAKSQTEVKTPNTGESILVNDTKPLTISQVNLLAKIIVGDYAALRIKIEQETAALIKQRKEEIAQERFTQYQGEEQTVKGITDWLKEENRRLTEEWRNRMRAAGVEYIGWTRDQVLEEGPRTKSKYKSQAQDLTSAEIAAIESRKTQVLQSLKVAELNAVREAQIAGVVNSGSAQKVLDAIPRAEDMLRQIAGETEVVKVLPAAVRGD